MDQQAVPRPKLAETVIDATVRLRETTISRCCEVLGDSALEYSELGDYSYLGPGCMIGDAQIGRFCAIAAQVRIGAPNHPLDRPSQHRFTYCPEYYTATAQRDHAFFQQRRADRVLIGNDVWMGHAVIVMPGVKVGDGAVLAAGAVVTPRCGALHHRGRGAGATDQGALQSRDCRTAIADRVVGLARRNHLATLAGISVRGCRGVLRALEFFKLVARINHRDAGCDAIIPSATHARGRACFRCSRSALPPDARRRPGKRFPAWSLIRRRCRRGSPWRHRTSHS